MASRTQHAKRNIITAVANKLAIMLANFVMRTVLIRYLGEVYLGLDSLFLSVLQILSLAELGVSSAMVYSMYKPLAENDVPAVCALLRLYRTVYRWIALAIAVLGLAIAPFLPLIVKKDLPDGLNLYVLFFINLGNSVLSYLVFAYRSALFTADQKYSINNNFYSFCKIGSIAVQIVLIVLFRDRSFCYYLYSFVLPLTTVVRNALAYALSKKMYPQYRCEGSVPEEEIRSIKKRVAGMFLYKISAVFQNSLDSVVLSAFLGLAMLGRYNTYYYVINAISGMMMLISESVTASVGNAIVLETREKNYADFRKFQLLYLWLSSWLSVCLVACLQPFVRLWVGEKMMFSDAVMVTFCVYFFTMHFSRICFMYRQAAGLWWQDRFRPIAETVVNLTLNILLVKMLGVVGVMLSTIVCLVFIDCTWGARTLFRHYFTEEKQSAYMLRLLWAWLLTASAGAVTFLLCRRIGLSGIPALAVNGVIATAVSNVIFAAGSSFLPEFKPSIAFVFKVIGVKKGSAKAE